MQISSRNTSLLKLVLAPLVATLTILFSAFFAFHYYHLNKRVDQYHSFIDHTLVTSLDRERASVKYIEDVVTGALSIEPYRSVLFISPDGEIIQQYGLPVNAQSIFTDRPHWQDENRLFLNFPLNNTLHFDESKTASRVAVAIDRSPAYLTLYQSIIFLLIVGIACTVLALAFSRHLINSIIRPIAVIQKRVNEYNQGQLDNPILIEDNPLFSNLTRDLNKFVHDQKLAQENTQQSIDQSIEDLRETLETVEIQNIELDLARKNALAASRVKSEFLANTSHEIRTPLNGILGFSGLLAKTDLSSQQKEYVNTISESAKVLLTTINDILDFSRLEIGTLSLDYKPVRIRQIVEEVLKFQTPLANEKKVRLLTIIEHDIPEHLLGDPLRLKQVFSTLMANSISLAESSYILVRIRQEEEYENQYTLKFSISSTGTTLSQEQRESLFDSYIQLDNFNSENANATANATGLGLAIAKGLVDRMKGRIGVESSESQGITFWFTSTLGIDPNGTSRADYLFDTLSDVTAILFDPDPMGRAEIAHYLKGWGVKVVEPEDLGGVLTDAKNIFQAGQKNIVIIDTQLNKNENRFDEIVSLINNINAVHSTPVILLCPPTIQRLMESQLIGSQNICIHRPALCNRLHESICRQLGIVSETTSDRNTAGKTLPPASKATAIKVLAVDDNEANLKLVNELLKDMNIEVQLADNGEAAAQLATTNAFDLILMDIQMPGMDGLEATRRIREMENGQARTPIIALTAHAVSDNKSKLLLAGMDDYLSKPISESELKHLVQRWAKRSSPAWQSETYPVVDRIRANAVAGNPSVVDVEESLSLAKNKRDLARDMLKMLIDSLPKSRSDIHAHYEAEDYAGLQEVVHKLHGGSCYCGVPQLRESSSTLDKLLVKKQIDNLDSLIGKIILDIDNLVDWANKNDLDALFETVKAG